MSKPCANCPWRRDAPPEYWDPQHFRSISKTCRDDGTALMLCHKAGRLPKEKQNSIVCQGWVRVVGYDAIGVRIAVLTGRVKDKDVGARDGLDLYDSFDEMLKANRIGR